MNKRFGALVFSILFFSMSLVSAQLVIGEGKGDGAFSGLVENIQDGGKAVYEVFGPVLEIFVGSADGLEKGEFLAKVLFLIIILAIAFIVLEKVPLIQERAWVLWLISIAVALLSVRWMGDSEIIQAIILPYSAFGIALSAGIPFFLYFFVVKEFNRIGRKIAWILFAVVFVGLWVMRFNDFSSAGGKAFSFIYLITAVLALIMLLADKSIQRAYKKSRAESKRDIANIKRRAKLMKEREELNEQHGKIPAPEWNALDRNLKEREKKADLR
jgi:hypothetical protein